MTMKDMSTFIAFNSRTAADVCGYYSQVVCVWHGRAYLSFSFSLIPYSEFILRHMNFVDSSSSVGRSAQEKAKPTQEDEVPNFMPSSLVKLKFLY